MRTLHEFLESYLQSAREDLAEFNQRFVQEVPISARNFAEEVLSAFAASLDILELIRQDLESGSQERSPAGEAEGREIITILDRDGTIQFESAGITPELGYSTEELVGRSVFDLIHPADRERMRCTYAEGLRQPGRSVQFHLRFRHADGSWRWLHSVARSTHGGGEASGYVAHSFVGGAGARPPRDEVSAAR